ncbi:single-stranded DNA-binding protein [Xanthomonas campestris pv. campestris]|uniref:single-stranded DNA-binding protein n=1 Tax=Xanthomonas campestris TaxID=339 RepID=UPI001E4483D0|nr:single-stranded DNA-binding protein [Xanthomonas campestris]MCD0253107.1 single-stranded DNA-binding protein [Xanthomonas campestris pv. campestris]
MRLPYKNLTIFAGYVGNEPELRQLTNSGDATVSLRIVAKHSWQVEGVWKTEDEWITAVFYRSLAEQVIATSVRKGSFVHVEGRRHTRSWMDAKQQRKVTHEIIVTEWHEIAISAAARRADIAQAAPPSAGKPAPAATKPTAPAKPKTGQTPPPITSTGAFA